MKTVTVSIKETAPGSFRVSHDGRVFGDSQGYNRDRAIAEAKKFVANRPVDGDWKGSAWVEHRNVIDPTL